jgi:hypothetical protein
MAYAALGNRDWVVREPGQGARRETPRGGVMTRTFYFLDYVERARKLVRENSCDREGDCKGGRIVGGELPEAAE